MSSEDGSPVDWARLEFLEDGTPFAVRYDDDNPGASIIVARS